MQTHFLTYYTSGYEKSAKRLIKSARKFGLNNQHIFNRNDLEQTEFYKQHRNILDLPQRAGCSLWKIYYMHSVYFKMNEGDVLFYADAGSEIIRNPQPLIDIANKEGVCLFNLNNHPKNNAWTKRDAFILMNTDNTQCHETPQTNAFAQLYKKNKINDAFMNEMLKYGCDIRIIGDFENTCGLPNFEGFKEHRYDQSVLGILTYKYKFELHRYPAQWGNHWKLEKYRKKGEWKPEPYSNAPMLNSDYDTIFDHHRNYSVWNEMKKKAYWIGKYYLIKHKIKMAIMPK